DFELWSRFFCFEPLYSCDCLIGGFRQRVRNQLSLENWEAYQEEAQAVLQRTILSEADRAVLGRLEQLHAIKRFLRKTRLLNFESLQVRLDAKIWALHEYPKRIQFNRYLQRFYLG